MRRLFQLPIIVGVILFAACKPSRNHSSGPFTGKVISGICAQYTIQLISGDMDPARYVKDWKHPMKDTVLHNVFSLRNPCYFESQHLQIGDTFLFMVVSDSPVESCVTCFVYEPTPPIANTIKVIHSAK